MYEAQQQQQKCRRGQRQTARRRIITWPESGPALRRARDEPDGPGAGAWGTALAASVAPRHPTLLWARDAAQCAAMRDTRRNERYLPASPCRRAGGDERLRRRAAHAQGALRSSRRRCRRFSPRCSPGCPIYRSAAVARRALAARASSRRNGRFSGSRSRDLRPEWRRVGALSGPSFAAEVARGQATAPVVASRDAALRGRRGAARRRLRIYTSDDVVGVEVGGAVKNVLAIAVGICDGLSAGLNARAA